MTAGILGLAIFALFVAPSAARAQGQIPAAGASLPSYRARLLGVYNMLTGEVIEGAEVSDVLSHTSALTTKTGTVSLSFLPDGGSLVRIQKLGFQPATIVVSIAPADTLPFTILLKPAVQTLPAVVSKDSAPHYLSPGLRAFEERRRTGPGLFLSDADLRKNDSRSMSDVIRTLGLNVRCSTMVPIQCFALSNRVGCEFGVYVDGVRVMYKDDRDLERMHVDATGGVEAYLGPATIPVEYNMTGSACGVLLFWTRER